MPYSTFQRLARWRRVRVKRIRLSQFVKDALQILLGVASAAFGLKSFLLPSGFLDGGVTGISLLITALTGWPLPVLIFIINLPFIVMGYLQVSKRFAFKTLLAVALLAAVLALVPLPEMTHDKLLISIFGGFFLGAGIGFSIRGGCVLDGTEVLALFLSRKLVFTIGDIILFINILIFLLAAVLINTETALYAMLTYFSASKTIDLIITGLEEYTGIFIISERSEHIRYFITHEMGSGVTIFKGERGFGKRGEQGGELNILYTVITRLEVQKLKNGVEKLDSHAFLIQQHISDTRGGMIRKKRHLH